MGHFESGGQMPEERLSQTSAAAVTAAETPWSDHYDMSPLPHDMTSAYRLLPDPNSGIAITPFAPSGTGNRLATLEMWAPSVTPSAQSVITQSSAQTCPQAGFARSAHLQVMGELTVSIAHEICQPLLAIASNAAACMRWLQRDKPNLDEAVCGLRDIRADCERAAGIVAALRALAKQSPCKPQPVDIDAVIREVIRLNDGHLARHGVTLETAFHAEHAVIADPIQIQQLVFNLVTNAIEAMAGCEGSNRILRVSSRSLPDGIQVSVEDNGPGIPLSERQQIFGAFYTTKTSGLGMGLTICRSVVEAHKGNLYAEASELGGAMIRFQLPKGCKNH